MTTLTTLRIGQLTPHDWEQVFTAPVPARAGVITDSGRPKARVRDLSNGLSAESAGPSADRSKAVRIIGTGEGRIDRSVGRVFRRGRGRLFLGGSLSRLPRSDRK